MYRKKGRYNKRRSYGKRRGKTTQKRSYYVSRGGIRL
jgi:hypothetical protein